MASAAEKYMQDLLGSSSQAKKEELEAVKQSRSIGMDMLMSGLSGIGRGITGIAGLGGDIQTISRLAKRAEQAGAKKFTEAQLANLPSGAAEAIRRTAQEAPVDVTAPTALLTSQQVYDFLEGTVLPEGTLTYKPQTMGGRIAQMAGEFGSAGALGRAPVKGAMMYGGIGAGAGGVSEVSPTAGAVAGIAGGVGAGTLASRRRGVESLLGDVVGEQTPAMLARAEQLQEQGRRIGVPLTAAESMESPSLRTLASSVAASPESAGIISQRLAGRKEAIPQAIERGILGVEEAPTGMTGTLLREASEAATKAISAKKRARTSKTTDFYEAAKSESISSEPLAKIIADAKELKKTLGRDSRAEIDRFINRISEVKTVNKKKTRVPITNVGRLDSEYKAFRDRANLDPTTNPDAPKKEASAILKDLNKRLDEALLTNENLAEARNIFREATPEVVRVVDDSGLKAIARANKRETIIEAITDPDNANAESISIVYSSLNKQDKTVFPKIAKNWLESAGDRAQKISTKGEMPLSAGVKFVQQLRGTPEKKKVLNSVLDGVANAKGVDSANMKKGFNNMLDVLQRTNLIDAFGSPTATREATKQAIEETAGILPTALQLQLTAPVSQAGRAMQRRSTSRAYKQIAEAMVADDAVNAIMRLALLDPKSRQAQNLVANIINPVRETSEMLQSQPQQAGGLLGE